MAKKLSREKFEALLSSRPDGIDEETARSVLQSTLGEEGFEVENRFQYEIDAEEQGKWAKQNPKSAMLERMSGPGKAIGEGLGALAGGINDLYDKVPDPLKQLPMAGLGFSPEQLFATGKGVNRAGQTLEDMGDEKLVRPGPAGARQNAKGMRALGIGIQNLNPFPESLGEGAVMGGMAALGGLAPKGALNTTKKLGRAMEEGGAVEKGLAGLSETSNAIIEQRKLPKIHAAMDKVIADKELLRSKLGEARRVPDYGELGLHFQDDLSEVKKLAREPLEAKRKTLTEYADRYLEKEPPTLVIEKARDVQDDLFGVISNSKDNAVGRLLSKYIDLEDGVYKAVTGQDRPVTLTDLQKDSTRLFDVAKRLQRTGDKQQARAVYKLREAVEDEIQRRMDTVDPAIAPEYAANRSQWKQYYDTYESDFAWDLKESPGSAMMEKIFKSPESVSEAQKVMSPEAYAKAKSLKTKELIEDLARSKDPEKFLKKEVPGYYERVYGQIDAARLEDFARRITAEKKLSSQISEIEKTSGVLKTKTPDMIRSLAGGSFGMMFWYTNHPWLAAASVTAGLAPEALARAYVKAGPSMRKAIESLASDRKSLGKLGPAKNVPIVQAFVAGQQESAFNPFEGESKSSNPRLEKKERPKVKIPDSWRGKVDGRIRPDEVVSPVEEIDYERLD